MAFPYSVLLSISYSSLNLKILDCDLFGFGTNVAVFFLADCKTSIACMASIVEASPLDAQWAVSFIPWWVIHTLLFTAGHQTQVS